MYRSFLPLVVLAICGCRCEILSNNKKCPHIIWEHTLPNEMRDYRGVSSPIVYKDYIILSARNSQTIESTFFKLRKEDASFHSMWNERVFWSLDFTDKYVFNDQLIYNNRNEEVIAISLTTMETSWRIPLWTSRDGFKILDHRIYVTRHDQGSIEFHEVDLTTRKVQKVHAILPIEYGYFTTQPEPFFYHIDAQNNGMVYTGKNADGFFLRNYNYTANELVWEIGLPEFDSYSETSPVYIEVTGDNIVVSSNDYISVKSLSKGVGIWHNDKDASFRVEPPLVTDDFIISPTNRLYCYDIRTGRNPWIREDDQDGIGWGSGIDMLVFEETLYFSRNPINILTGEAYWVHLDRYGNQKLPFGQPPGIDATEGVLYYTGRDEKLFKVRMPD